MGCILHDFYETLTFHIVSAFHYEVSGMCWRDPHVRRVRIRGYPFSFILLFKTKKIKKPKIRTTDHSFAKQKNSFQKKEFNQKTKNTDHRPIKIKKNMIIIMVVRHFNTVDVDVEIKKPFYFYYYGSLVTG